MAGLAIAFGATSYYAGNQYLDDQTRARMSALEARGNNNSELKLATVVVAKKALRFGQTLEQNMLKTIEWPKNSMPEGSYPTIKEIIGNGERRVIKSMEPGEPVLAVKLTGENGRAGLAGIIGKGMRAVTIPVDMVDGVGGFVQPGDRVDIILTRESEENRESTAKVIMQNVKVLSVDQEADTRSNTAKIAQSVTLEASTGGAQKLALANKVGRLSLLLRSAGDEGAVNAASLSSGDLADQPASEGGIFSLFGEQTTTTVRVIAGDDVTSVTVPIDRKNKISNKINN